MKINKVTNLLLTTAITLSGLVGCENGTKKDLTKNLNYDDVTNLIETPENNFTQKQDINTESIEATKKDIEDYCMYVKIEYKNRLEEVKRDKDKYIGDEAKKAEAREEMNAYQRERKEVEAVLAQLKEFIDGEYQDMNLYDEIISAIDKLNNDPHTTINIQTLAAYLKNKKIAKFEEKM